MSVHKRKYDSGKITWSYIFDAPWSTLEKRVQLKRSGFQTKKEAVEAEAARRTEATAEHDAMKCGNTQILPKTLGQLLEEFYSYCSTVQSPRTLSPKTIERYRETSRYLDPSLLAFSLPEITPLHLHREWERLLRNGGQGRHIGGPLSAKTVRNFAGVLSGAFGRAILWGLAETNPVTNSEPPIPQPKEALALSIDQEQLLVDASTHPVLPMILELAASLGARRGEVMALRWSDERDGRALIARSLCQTKDGLHFKTAKGRNVRLVTIPESCRRLLDNHRERQAEFRRQFGPDYRIDLDLIVCQPNGEPLKPDSISAAASLLARKLKLPKGASLHSLRHTHASQLLAGGMEISAVSARLGHKSVGTTLKIYAHMIEGRDEEAARIWERLNKREPEAERKKM